MQGCPILQPQQPNQSGSPQLGAITLSGPLIHTEGKVRLGWNWVRGEGHRGEACKASFGKKQGGCFESRSSLLVLSLVVLVLVANVDDQHDKAREDAEGPHDQVGDAQEGVLAPHPGDAA